MTADNFQYGTVSARAGLFLFRLRRLLPDSRRIAVTRTGYGLFAPGDFLAYNDQRLRLETEEICGVKVSRTYRAYCNTSLFYIAAVTFLMGLCLFRGILDV